MRRGPGLMAAQRGSALLFTLVILLLLTVASLAVARMSRSDLVTLNSRQRSTALLQAADSAVEQELAEGPAPFDAPRAMPAATINGVAVSGETRFETRGEVPSGGFSLGGEFNAYHFEVDATADDGEGGSVEVQAGFYVIGPTG